MRFHVCCSLDRVPQHASSVEDERHALRSRGTFAAHAKRIDGLPRREVRQQLDLQLQPTDPPNADRSAPPAMTDLRLQGLRVNQ